MMVLSLVTLVALDASGQEDYRPTRRTPATQSFGRFINPTDPPRKVDNKPARESKGFGGLFLPLKSFSNAFRNDSQDAGDELPADMPQRPSREPFQNQAIEKPTQVEDVPPRLPRDEPIIQRVGPPIASTTDEGASPAVPTPEVPTKNEPRIYAANPKPESIDSKGTSRRTKNPSVAAAMEKISKSNRSEPSTTSNPTPSEPYPVPSRSKPNKTNESEKQTASTPAITPVSRSTRSFKGGQSNAGIDLHIPGLHLKMVGPDSILIGKAVPYELIASNEGRTDLEGLTVRILLPASATIQDPTTSNGNVQPISEGTLSGLAWQVNQIPSGASRSLKIMIRTEQPEHFALSLDWKLEGSAGELPVRVQQPQLILALEGPSEADFGRPQTFRLRVRNPGNATAEKVRVQLQAEPNGINEELLGDLLPGTERILEVELTFQQAGKLPVLASAVSEASNLQASRSIDVDVRQAELVATWNGPEEFYQGNIADYTLTVENQGTIDALDNDCQVEIPEGMDLVTLPPGITRTANTLRWNITKLAAGESSQWDFQFAMNQSGQNRLKFKATSSSGEPTQSDFQTNVDAVADLALAVDDPISPAPVGKPVVYQITITNRGKKAAEDVFVIAQFSEGIEPSKIDGHTGKLVPGQALFEPIPKIEPGQEIKLLITAEASKPGTHRFRAAVRCQGSEDDLLKEESTRYAASGTRSNSPK